MTNVLYTRAQLQSKKLSELKAIALQLNITPFGDKRIATNWVEAILTAQPQPVAMKEEVRRKEEGGRILSHPSSLFPLPSDLLVEMNGDDCIASGKIVASITSDEDLTQPWVVKINSIEVHRAATWARCYDYVRTHAKYGTLPNPQPELVNDYLFHEDPQQALLSEVGDSHFIGLILLRCIEVGTDYATVWDVAKDGLTIGEIQMGWDCFWSHTLSFATFATPQEAVADLIGSATLGLVEQELEVLPIIDLNVFAVTNHKTGKRYEVCFPPYSCTCPHWANRHRQEGFQDKHIEAVKNFLQSSLKKLLCTS